MNEIICDPQLQPETIQRLQGSCTSPRSFRTRASRWPRLLRIRRPARPYRRYCRHKTAICSSTRRSSPPLSQLRPDKQRVELSSGRTIVFRLYGLLTSPDSPKTDTDDIGDHSLQGSDSCHFKSTCPPRSNRDKRLCGANREVRYQRNSRSHEDCRDSGHKEKRNDRDECAYCG